MLGNFKRVSLSCSIFACISCISIGEVSWVKFLPNDHHATSTFCALIDRWCFLVIQFHVCMVCMYIDRMYNIMACTIGTRTSGMRRWLFWQWPLLFYQARVSPQATPKMLSQATSKMLSCSCSPLAAVLHCCRITLEVALVLEPDLQKIGKEGLVNGAGWKCTLWNVRDFINYWTLQSL